MKDFFNRLPEDLQLFIFNRVADLKSLLRCTLVSKHFASLVPRVRTVSLTVFGSGATSGFPHRFNQFEILLQSFDYLGTNDPHILKSVALQPLKVPLSLEKFKELESISLDYVAVGPVEDYVGSLFSTWKVKFADNSARIESFVVLVAETIYKDAEYAMIDDDFEEQECQEDANLDLKIMDCIWVFYGRYMEWLCLVQTLVESNASLQCVTITDSEKKVKLVVRDEHLAKIGRDMFDDLFEHLSNDRETHAYLRVLHLPLTGNVMRWPILEVYNSVTEEKAREKKFEDIMNWDFEDELAVLGEAVKVILKNHRDKFTS